MTDALESTFPYIAHLLVQEILGKTTEHYDKDHSDIYFWDSTVGTYTMLLNICWSRKYRAKSLNNE